MIERQDTQFVVGQLKTYTFEKLANVYNIKTRRQGHIIKKLVQNVEKYIFYNKEAFDQIRLMSVFLFRLY